MSDEESLIINLNSQGPYMVDINNLAEVQYLCVGPTPIPIC